VVTRDTGVGLKPSPEPLLYIVRKWRLKPEEVLMVGDFLYDMLMGRRAGCRTAFVTNGEVIPPELDADLVITRLDELISFLIQDRSIQ
jgi:phosphoglycolate phosphatase-like HAD superfamily hydrolase